VAASGAGTLTPTAACRSEEAEARNPQLVAAVLFLHAYMSCKNV
jgi:hypothetical protein